MEMEFDDYYDYGKDDTKDDDDDSDDGDENNSDDGDENDSDDTDDDDDNDNNKVYNKYKQQQRAQYYLRMIRTSPLFASQPRLERICKDWKNDVLSSSFRKYTFRSNENDSVNKIHEKIYDLKYLLKLCGFNLTSLDLSCYPNSKLMPIINANCPKLLNLSFRFKEIISQDFENCFSNMYNLHMLSIYWKCEETLPMTLAKSLEQIGETLEVLKLSCCLQGNDLFSPDSLAPVFPRLIVLKRLEIYKFGLSQLLIQSISEIKNLRDLSLRSRWPKNHPMFDTRINMYPIGNMKNLWSLDIDCDYGVRDEFLINLCNNAKKLVLITVTGTNITDIGMSAINNSEQLHHFDLGLAFSYFVPKSSKNEFITDESIQCLFNQELETVNISNCINI
ncbi:hypothetical protein HCN44_011057 [Aphidius gifuensis]|uniref:Uncharacterized protein n=1 Tax=Aphidius gifuensis TaxID=684658 RepID=A0A834Y446_APHGI|nr:hypothetical protein HCN44_011057 [Aphidius gifuensis]